MTNSSTSFAGSSTALRNPGDTVLSASYSWQQPMPRPRSITHPLKLKARLEQIIISKGNLNDFRILFQTINSNYYIEQDYIEQDTISVTYVIRDG